MYEHQDIERSSELRQLAGNAPQKVDSPTSSRICELREEQSATQKLLDELAEKLSDVLSPDQPSGDGKTIAGSLPPSPLCQEIEYRISLQRGINARLSALLLRITV